jgi:hypothetical protein
LPTKTGIRIIRQRPIIPRTLGVDLEIIEVGSLKKDGKRCHLSYDKFDLRRVVAGSWQAAWSAGCFSHH